MTSCPKCGQAISEDFGMVQCPNCEAIFRIEMDGSVLDADSIEEAQPFPEVPTDAGLPEEFQPVPFEEPVLDLGEPSLPPDEIHEEGHDEIQNETPGALDITAYAESPVSEARDGPYLYRLQIDGLDTQEMLQDFRRVLEKDPKLGLDAGLILSRITQGSLRIEGLNPAKAAILVLRLRTLRVQVSWEQYAYYEVDPE